MLLWIFDKQTKSFSLIGTYKSIGRDDYIGPDDESFVKIGDCCYELSKRFVNSFFNCLAVNPFKDYRFMVNREMFEEYGNNKFPVGGKHLGAELYEITKDGHITRNGFPTYPSSSTTVSLLMQFYHVVGYESITGRTDGEHGIDHLIEEGYTPTYYYAGNGSCCLLVRERNAVRTAPSLNEVPELLAIIKKINSKLVRGIMLSEYERMGRKERQHALELINILKHNLEDDLNFKAKAIGAYVRSAMEDFHVKHLSDEQMKELNPIIRNAIFTFLTDEKNGNLFGISSVCKCNLASYWEDCKYLKM